MSGLRSLLRVAMLGAAAACVTTRERIELVDTNLATPSFAVAQEIPFADASATAQQRTLIELYHGVMVRLEQAVQERDLPQLYSLLEAYERTGVPPWAESRLRGYRAIGHGLAFQLHAAAAGSLVVVGQADGAPPPPIGEPMALEFVLPPAAEPVRLDGRDSQRPIGFAVALAVEDQFVGGGTMHQSRQEVVWLPELLDLRSGTEVRLPIGLDLPAADAVLRRVTVRVDLLPGYVTVAEMVAPIQRTAVAALTLTQYPRGHEPIARAPLATLREALRLGDAAHFQHVFLGAWFTQGADRELALGLLVDSVRLGTEPQAVVAMATLRYLTGIDVPIGEREPWLAWWQGQRAKRPRSGG